MDTHLPVSKKLFASKEVTIENPNLRTSLWIFLKPI